MKKIIFGLAILVTAGVSILAACNKQDVLPTSNKIDQSVNIEKSGSLTDGQLIDIIKGRNSNYSKIEEIEEVLFENCKLKSSVIQVLIDETRIPNYVVEEMMILSNPSVADINYLRSVRPTLSTVSIVAAGSVDLLNSQFVVFNLNPRQIFIAKGMTQKSLCLSGCGESEFKGTDFIILNLTSTTTPLDPAQIADCDAGKWVCGKAVESRIVLNEGSTTIVVTKCEGTTEKCVRKATQPK
jgi:hypothetical protein